MNTEFRKRLELRISQLKNISSDDSEDIIAIAANNISNTLFLLYLPTEYHQEYKDILQKNIDVSVLQSNKNILLFLEELLKKISHS